MKKFIQEYPDLLIVVILVGIGILSKWGAMDPRGIAFIGVILIWGRLVMIYKVLNSPKSDSN